MSGYAEGLVGRTPSPLDVLFEEASLIFHRQRAWLAFFMMVMIGYGFVPSYNLPGVGDPYLFYQGRPGLLGSFMFLVLSLIWGLAVWADMPRGGRTHQLSLPLGSVGRLSYRTLAGALLLVVAVTASLVLGGLGCFLIKSGTGYFSTELAFSVKGMFWTQLGLLNAYLLATLAALRFRRPDYVVLWALFGLIAASMAVALFENPIPVQVISSIIGPLFTGMGLWGPTQVTVAGSATPGPMTIAVLFGILVVAVPATMLRTREG